MIISKTQLANLAAAIRAGLSAYARPLPLTASEWADEHFYLPSESSYTEGRWETLYFQRAILNSMGSDAIQVVNLFKSARVGYTKLLLATAFYLVQHKKRNGIIYQPTNPQGENFMKSHVEPSLRDVPVMRAISPWLGKKHRDSTLTTKVFAIAKTLWVLGGNTPDNFREKSADFVIYDELAAFLADIGKEGRATGLGDTRLELAMFPKSIRGSTPTTAGECQMETAAEEGDLHLHLYVVCPHCGTEQVLLWGGKDDCEFGIKWENDNPATAYYHCAAEGCRIYQHQLGPQEHLARWICEKTGIWTRDAISWFDKDNQPVDTPTAITWYIWSAYNPLAKWTKLVADFLKAKQDPLALKAFINTKLGQLWQQDTGEKLDWQVLHGRREVYPAPIPDDRIVFLSGGIDQQDDRIEFAVYGWAPGEESWLLWTYALYGDPASDEMKRKAGELLHTSFLRRDGTPMYVDRWCWDQGGHYTDEVQAASKKHGLRWVIPVFGASTYGKPIANFPKKKNAAGVYRTEVGTDNAKDVLMARLKIQLDTPGDPKPGYIHFPMDDDIAPESYFQQLTAERKVRKLVKGRHIFQWDAGGRRNEQTDMFVYALAALRVSQQKFGLNLEREAAKAAAATPTNNQPERRSMKALGQRMGASS